MPRRSLVVIGVVAAALLLAELAGLIWVRQAFDDRHQVSAARLQVALETFRPSLRPGQAELVDAATLAPAGQTRANPARCLPLVRLNTTTPADGATWTGADGQPLQPVRMLVVRYTDAAQARAELDRKRWALLRCGTVQLTFPPFRQPARPFTVSGRFWPPALTQDRMSFALTGQSTGTPGSSSQRYTFYLRRYGNVLVWTYGDDPTGVALRRAAVDDLTRRLAQG